DRVARALGARPRSSHRTTGPGSRRGARPPARRRRGQAPPRLRPLRPRRVRPPRPRHRPHQAAMGGSGPRDPL
ncbi:MAG: hypothetical protein AVDCRST_MAG40-785, partial [uncultured Gemmatimonadaceae bacterium]